MTTTRVVLACDEAGAKGYADRDEQIPGELGVFAGLLFDANMPPIAEPVFTAAAERYTTAEGKLHITDLSQENQQALREEMFSLIRTHKLTCFYEAIHVAGFHHVFQQERAMLERAGYVRHSPIKLPGNVLRAQPGGLHSALFQGLYGKAVAFCIDRGKERIRLEVRLDRVDLPILEEFNADAVALLNTVAHIKKVTGFDPATQRKFEGAIKTEIIGGPEFRLTIEELTIKPVDGIDGFIVAANVLANSVNYYLGKARPLEERFRALNTPIAIARHPLSDCFVYLSDSGRYNVADTLYRHPEDPDLAQDSGQAPPAFRL